MKQRKIDIDKIEIKSVILISDTFLPLIDGVCNTVVNYQKVLEDKYHIKATVITPKQKNFDYNAYPYDVILMKSLSTEKSIGYRGGIPLPLKAIKILKKNPPDIIHVHTPFVALSYAIILRYIFKCPIIFTYHTKYDYELRGRIKNKALYKVSHRSMVDQIKCADEAWSVNESVRQDLVDNGCDIKTITMENGTDMSSEPLSEEIRDKYTKKYLSNDNRLIFLFVGRHFWVKGFKVTLNALIKLKKKGIKFTFLSIGDGYDANDIKEYAHKIGLTDEDVKFLGEKKNKEELKAFYEVADLFLFPSIYDCCGLVVLEAAACKTASILIRGSDAASNKKDNIDCFLIDNNADSMYELLVKLNDNRQLIKDVSVGAFNNIYIQWDKAIDKAIPRYKQVIKMCYERDKKQRHVFFVAFVLKITAYVLNFLSLFVIVKKEKNK